MRLYKAKLAKLPASPDVSPLLCPLHSSYPAIYELIATYIVLDPRIFGKKCIFTKGFACG